MRNSGLLMGRRAAKFCIMALAVMFLLHQAEDLTVLGEQRRRLCVSVCLKD